MELETHSLESTNTRYTIGQFTQLNHGRVKLSPALEEKLSHYTMPACALEREHNNPYNICFKIAAESSAPTKKPLLARKEGIYDDAHILSSLRHAFSSIAKGTGRTLLAVTDINQIMIPKTMVEKVAELFFDVIVQCPKQMNEYLKVLFGLSYPDQDHMETRIHFYFVKYAVNSFENPRVLQDSILEDGAGRTKKHREATCELLARLYIYQFGDDPKHDKPRSFFSNQENVTKRFLDPVFAKIDTGDANEVKNLIKIWDLLKSCKKFDLSQYLPRIKILAENKDMKFKMTTVLLLRDFI